MTLYAVRHILKVPVTENVLQCSQSFYLVRCLAVIFTLNWKPKELPEMKLDGAFSISASPSSNLSPTTSPQK